MQSPHFKKIAALFVIIIGLAGILNLIFQAYQDQNQPYFQKDMPESTPQLVGNQKHAETADSMAIYIATGASILITTAFAVMAWKRKK